MSGTMSNSLMALLLSLFALAMLGACAAGGDDSGFQSSCKEVSVEQIAHFYPDPSYLEGPEGALRGEFICAGSSSAEGSENARKAISAFEALEGCCRTTPQERLEAAWLYAHEFDDNSRAKALLCSASDSEGHSPARASPADVACESPLDLASDELKNAIETALEELYLP